MLLDGRTAEDVFLTTINLLRKGSRCHKDASVFIGGTASTQTLHVQDDPSCKTLMLKSNMPEATFGSCILLTVSMVLIFLMFASLALSWLHACSVCVCVCARVCVCVCVCL